jgi:hypothetical protein
MNKSDNEKKKYAKEKGMCVVAADNGFEIELLSESNRANGNTYDIRMNGEKAELKCITGGASNIVKYAKHALEEQGANIVLYEIPNYDKKYYEKLAEAKRKTKGRILFYLKDTKIIKEII